MGLDMYLSKKHYVQNWDHDPKNWEVTVTLNGEPYPDVDSKRVTYVTEQVMYWRKANAIHAWFVRNVQGGIDECQVAHVSREQLEELLKDVEAALVNGKKGAEQVLPTESGFFFGGTEYDEWYWDSLKETRKMLLAESKSWGEGYQHPLSYPDYEYQSSW